MIFTVGNSVTAIEASEAAIKWIYELLSFPDLTKAFRGKTDKFYLLSLFDNSFPTGLLDQLLRELRDLEASEERPAWLDSIEVVDQRVRPVAPVRTANLKWLRDYQRDPIAMVCMHDRGILELPTGSGKTEAFIGLTRVLPCRWLFIAPRVALAKNAAARWLLREIELLQSWIDTQAMNSDRAELIQCQIDDLYAQRLAITSTERWAPLDRSDVTDSHVGIIGDGADTADLGDHGSCLVFATFQTLASQLEGRGGDVLRWAQALCVDEVHQQAADSFYRVTQAAENAFYRVGLSGTPLLRGDKRNPLAIGSIGRLLYKVRIKTLIDRKFFAYPIMRFASHDVSSDAPSVRECHMCAGKGEYQDEITLIEIACKKCNGKGKIKPKYRSVYAAAIVNSKTRNALCAKLIKRAAKPCIAFVERTNHGKAVARLCKRLGLTVVFMDSTTHAEDWKRAREVKKLEAGELDAIITTRIIREGWDIPGLQSVVKLNAGKSEIAILQELGRASRPDGSRSPSFEFWDIADVGQSNLAKQARARLKTLERETECPVEVISIIKDSS